MSYDIENKFVEDVVQIIEQARKKAYSATAFVMVEAYWLVGKRIVEDEQHGLEKASYGKAILEKLSKELGKGFGARTLRDFRQFYLVFPNWEYLAHLCAKLHWSHLRLIMRISDSDARNYYLNEASNHMWSVRTLDRNISTLYYQLTLKMVLENDNWLVDGCGIINIPNDKRSAR
jgi:hypothetical protein